MTTKTPNLWHRFWRDNHGKVVIWQTPNPLLATWFVFMILAKLTSAGHFRTGSEFVSAAALFGWAYLEITAGASYFRRLLGLIVLSALVWSHLM